MYNCYRVIFSKKEKMRLRYQFWFQMAYLTITSNLEKYPELYACTDRETPEYKSFF